MVTISNQETICILFGCWLTVLMKTVLMNNQDHAGGVESLTNNSDEWRRFGKHGWNMMTMLIMRELLVILEESSCSKDRLLPSLLTCRQWRLSSSSIYDNMMITTSPFIVHNVLFVQFYPLTTYS